MPDKKWILLFIAVLSVNALCWATPNKPVISSPSGSGNTYNKRPWIYFSATDASHKINWVRVIIDDSSDCLSPVYDYTSVTSDTTRDSFYPLPANSGQTIRHRLNPTGPTDLTVGTWYMSVRLKCDDTINRASPWADIKTIVISNPSSDITETITDGTTLIRADHFTSLKTAMDNVRTFRGSGAYSWDSTWSTLASGSLIKVIHMNDLRDALDAPYNSATGSNPTYTTPDPMTSRHLNTRYSYA